MKFQFTQNRPYDVVGIGRNSWDRIAIVDEYPPADSKVEVRTLEQQAGGQVATTLVAAARLGATTRYLGKFGDDAAGRAVRAALGKEEIDLSCCKVINGVSNQVSFVVVDRENKTRNVFGYCDPRLRPTSDDFTFEEVTSGKILFLGGRNPSDMLSYARDGRNAGCLVALDADTVENGIADLLSSVDIVICAGFFPTQFTGERSLQRALQDLASMGPQLICCTLGEEGAISIHEGQFLETKPLHVDVLDTTGAGDVFQGAFLVALLEDQSLASAMNFAATAAALKCRSIGGQSGIPTRKELDRLVLL